MKPQQLIAIKIATSIAQRLAPKVGQSEKDLARWIAQELKKANSTPAFRTIVASGKRSAIPHGYATNKKIKSGEFVVIDFGANYQGYRSDITRTICLGKPAAKQKKIFSIVAQAQKQAIKKVQAGQSCRLIDLAARNYIKSKGYGKYFIHTTGHGIETRVHQAPKISYRNRHLLKTGQVITIEPGIYIKGWGGVRIEDMVLVTKSGAKILTR